MFHKAKVAFAERVDSFVLFDVVLQSLFRAGFVSRLAFGGRFRPLPSGGGRLRQVRLH